MKNTLDFRCGRCRDCGWLFSLEGTPAVTVGGHETNAETVRRCPGDRDSGCRYNKWRAEQAAEKASKSGKPASGEGSAL